jgi:dTDP-4-amino-4,6-dideoxygalactose transaminase
MGANQSSEEAKTPIPLFKVFMSDTVDTPLLTTLHSGYITQGPKVDEFEQRLAKYFGTDRVLTTNSCTAAIHLAFRLLQNPYPEAAWPGYVAGDEVLTCPLTCTATNWPALANGMALKWVDVDPKTANMDLVDLERKLSPTTKVVIFVHWGGTPIDLDEVDAICDRCLERFGFRPKVIEDCAHALGAEYKGKKLGNHGHMCVFSFQAIKHITTVDGGMLTTPDDEYYRRGKLIRWFGIDRTKRSDKQAGLKTTQSEVAAASIAAATAKAEEADKAKKDFRAEAPIAEWGYKFHMNDVNAVIGIENLKHAERIISACQSNGDFLREELIGDRRVPGIYALDVPAGARSAYWLFTFAFEQPGFVLPFIEFMKSQGIAASQVHTRNDLHPTVAQYAPSEAAGTLVPQLEDFAERFVCVPVGWWVTPNDRLRIIAAIREFAEANELQSPAAVKGKDG